MKEIKAYVHNHRIADVIRAVKDYGRCTAHPGAGCRNLSVTQVQSLLEAVDTQEQRYSVELAEPVINESKLELLCDDGQADELVAIIERTARTGLAEAGWIYVIDVVNALPIRGVHK